MKKYSSMTAEVKDIIMKVMADGKEHSRQELLKNVEAEMEKPGELREGVYTGSIKILVGNGNLLTVSRGTYQLNLSASKDMELKRRVYLIIEGCKEQLSRSCSGVSLLGINEEAIQLASEVNEIIAYLNDVSARLDDTPLVREENEQEEKNLSVGVEEQIEEVEQEEEAEKLEEEKINVGVEEPVVESEQEQEQETELLIEKCEQVEEKISVGVEELVEESEQEIGEPEPVVEEDRLEEEKENVGVEEPVEESEQEPESESAVEEVIEPKKKSRRKKATN